MYCVIEWFEKWGVFEKYYFFNFWFEMFWIWVIKNGERNGFLSEIMVEEEFMEVRERENREGKMGGGWICGVLGRVWYIVEIEFDDVGY